jgi:hypothetical protein
VHNPFRVVIVQFFNGFAPFPNIQGWWTRIPKVASWFTQGIFWNPKCGEQEVTKLRYVFRITRVWITLAWKIPHIEAQNEGGNTKYPCQENLYLGCVVHERVAYTPHISHMQVVYVVCKLSAQPPPPNIRYCFAWNHRIWAHSVILSTS